MCLTKFRAEVKRFKLMTKNIMNFGNIIHLCLKKCRAELILSILSLGIKFVSLNALNLVAN